MVVRFPKGIQTKKEIDTIRYYDKKIVVFIGG